MNYRDLVSKRVSRGETTLQPPAPAGLLKRAQEGLTRRGTPLPVDYSEFLSQMNGLSWDGIRFHGLNRQRTGNDLLRSNDFLRQIRPEPRRLYVGSSESYLYAYDPSEGAYQRLLRGSMEVDTDFPRTTSMKALLTNIFDSRRPLEIARPVLGCPGLALN